MKTPKESWTKEEWDNYFIAVCAKYKAIAIENILRKRAEEEVANSQQCEKAEKKTDETK